MNFYSRLLNSVSETVADSQNQYQHVTERHLQAIWFEQKYFSNLTTIDGQCVKVLSPGIWNGEAGPDFLKAHLVIGNKNLRGDVEIHLSNSGWEMHRHHLDSRYNNVIFHLSLWKPLHEKSIATSNSQLIPQAYLEPFLTESISRLTKLIDLDLFPYHTYGGHGRCFDELFQDLPEKEIHSFFQKAAEWCLKKKLDYLRANSRDELLLGIAMALGYKNNTQAFRDLFTILSQKKLNENHLFALALASCGLFSEPYREKWKASTYYEELFQLSPNRDDLAKVKLTFTNIRPFNHPIRRLAYLVKLLSDPSKGILKDRMLCHWEQNWRIAEAFDNWKGLREGLEELLPAYEDQFWNRHYTFLSNTSRNHLPLLGASIRREIIVNAFLPVLFEVVINEGDPNEMQAFYQFYKSFPPIITSKSRYLQGRFFDDSKAVFQSAIDEQGSYQLHHDFCVHYEASCDGCPFVDKFKNSLQ